jgi:ribosome-associated heat shock protein Hsp15
VNDVRIDVLLHSLCLFKTRSQASRACSEGRVWLNGVEARASRDVRPGDRIRFRDALGRLEQEVEILDVPLGQVSKTQAGEMIRVVEKRVIDDPWA